jgi:hypothetical protein
VKRNLIQRVHVTPHSLPSNKFSASRAGCPPFVLAFPPKVHGSNPYSRALDLPGGVSKQPVARIPAEGHSSALNDVADLKEMREKWHKTYTPAILFSACNGRQTQAHMDRKKSLSRFWLLRMRLGLQDLRRAHGQFLR